MTAALDDVDDGRIASLAADVRLFRAKARTGSADPLFALIDNGLGYLIPLVAPLQEALDRVTGDPETLAQMGAEWADVATRLRALGPAVVEISDGTRATWTGPAAVAASVKFGQFARGALGVARQCEAVARCLSVSADLMGGAQDVIEGIITSWAEYAIVTMVVASATAAVTQGASVSAAEAAVVAEAAAACAEGAEASAEVADLLEQAAVLLEDFGGGFEELTRSVQHLARSLREPPAGWPGQDRPRTTDRPSPATTDETTHDTRGST